MGKYKIRYKKESVRVMIVEANSEDDANKKFEDFDCLEDYEEYGIDETIEEIVEI